MRGPVKRASPMISSAPLARYRSRCIARSPSAIVRLRAWTPLMFVDAAPISTPNSAARLMNERTFAEWMMFLLGRHATFGHDPPISFRSTTAVR